MSLNSDVLIDSSTVGLVPVTSNNVTIKPVNFDVNDDWILQQVKTRRSFYAINIRESEKLKENNEKDGKMEELQNCIEEKQNTSTKNVHDKGVRKKWTFILFDLTFCMMIATPMVIGYWMTTWSLMDRYHVPGDVIFVGGMAIHWTIAFFKNHLHESAMNALVQVQEDLATRILWKIKQIIYTYCFGIATIMHWRGGWIVFDEYFLDKFGGCMYMTAIMTGTLAVFRSLRNLIITPTSLYVDTLETTFDFPTRYQVPAIYIDLQSRVEENLELQWANLIIDALNSSVRNQFSMHSKVTTQKFYLSTIINNSKKTPVKGEITFLT